MKLGTFQEKLAKQRGDAIWPQIGALLVNYLGPPRGGGPFLAIVVLHGCGGRGPRLDDHVAGRLISRGYLDVVVDSFASREMTSTCQKAHGNGLFSITDRFSTLMGRKF